MTKMTRKVKTMKKINQVSKLIGMIANRMSNKLKEMIIRINKLKNCSNFKTSNKWINSKINNKINKENNKGNNNK
jgi:hypothetical protein